MNPTAWCARLIENTKHNSRSSPQLLTLFCAGVQSAEETPAPSRRERAAWFEDEDGDVRVVKATDYEPL